jgi:hypothetical protein
MFKKIKAQVETALRYAQDAKFAARDARWQAREARQWSTGAWNRLNDVEALLDSAGLMSAHLYRIPTESDIDVAELEAMVHMLADHLGLEWVTMPETSSWEQQVSLVQVVEHALGVLTNACALLDAEGLGHEKIDAALTELAVTVEALCST